MSLADFMFIIAILLWALFYMCIGAAIMYKVGPNRIARWLRLPPDDYE